jgi:Cytochrome c7 and related cytochrome c
MDNELEGSKKKVQKKTLLFFLYFIIALILIIITTTTALPQEIQQPIAFPHKIHIEDAELTCTDCHQYVETMAAAIIPNINLCSDCHSDEPLGDSPEELKLLKYIEKGERIPWQKIYSVPRHVYFSHRRHVKIGDIKCSACHGNVEEFTEPAKFPVWLPTMNNCIDCHKKNKVTYDCLACHR